MRAWSRKNLWEATPAWLKRAAGGGLGAVPPAWWLGSRFRRSLRFLDQAQGWSADQARQYQLGQLRRICTLAYERSSYYRRVFQQAGFDPRDLRMPEDFAPLPTIDKTTVREHLEEMCTRPGHGGRVDRVSTGGSNGGPLFFYIDASRSAVEYAHLVASWRRAGYETPTAQAVFRGQVVRPDRSGLRHSFDPLLRRHYYSNFHMTDADMRRYIEHLRQIGPCYLHVYPSSIAMLTRFVERERIEPPENVRGILAGSEMVYAADRARAERTWGVRYFSWYGHSEKLVLAAECEYSSDYHVWPTYGYCELVDGAGRPVRTPGQSGEIVGTGFINTVMPFIRYRTGDFATYVGECCAACGREHLLVREVQGHRTQELLAAADGAWISWTALNMHDETFARVQQFQFFQDTVGRATLRIVPRAGFDSANVARILRNLERKLDGRLRIDVQVCKQIPLTPRGKAIYVDQRLTPPGTSITKASVA